MKRILPLVILLFYTLFSIDVNSQYIADNGAIKGAKRLQDHISICYASDESHQTRVPNKNPKFLKLKKMYEENPEAARSFQDNLKTSEIQFIFGPGMEANEEAKEAIRFAADLWELELVSSVPIVIFADLEPLGSGVLGSTGTTRVTNVPGAPDPSYSYASSTGNSIAGVDLVPGVPDMTMTYSSDFNWYFGTDQNTPSNQQDFTSVALHEIGHGMGIFGNNNLCQGIGLNQGNNPSLWDILAVTDTGTPVLDLGFGSDEQIAELTGNNLFMSGFNATKALENTSNPPKIYVPATCAPGSSFSHWDETTFPPGDPNTLMTPFQGNGESSFDIGDFTRGYLEDAGWTLANPNAQFDLGVSNIESPSNKPEFTNSEIVTIRVGNLGEETIQSVIISYKVDDGDWITEEFVGSLGPNQERDYQFTQTADLSVNEEYTITARLDYFIDEFQDNNEAFKLVREEEDIVDPPDPITFPYVQSWESGEEEWVSDGDWELGVPAGSIINSASDGNHAWVTNLTGNYPDNSFSTLISPTFDFSDYRDPLIEVDIWYDIETGWDGAALQVSLDNGSNWETVGEWGDPNNWYTDGPARTGTGNGDDGVDALEAAVGNGNGWTGTDTDGSGGWVRASQRVPLVDESTVKFRFVFASDGAETDEGFAVDNIRIAPDALFDNDVSIIEITGPEDGNLGSSEVISAIVKNVGKNEVTGFDIKYSIDGGIDVQETINSTLAAEEELEYFFTTGADFSVTGLYEVSVSTDLTGDENPGNDNLTKQVENILNVSIFPYRESFEAGQGNWKTSGTATSWELGTPSNNIINTASDGSNAWVTSLDGDYNNNETSFLESPGFNFQGFSEPVIGFDIWFEEEPLTDAVLFQYSTDNGGTWITLGETSDNTNWYNQRDLITQRIDENAPGWNWSSGGYITAFHTAPELAGESFVIFRFAFVSDAVNTNEGVAVDNVRVFDNATVNFTIECSPSITVNTDAGQDFAFLDPGNPIVDVDGNPTILISNNFNNTSNPAGNYPIGDTFVTFVVDVDGLLGFCATRVRVIDNEEPLISCPEDVLVALESGQTDVSVSYEIPQATDNVGFTESATFYNRFEIDEDAPTFTCSGEVRNSFVRAFDLIDDFGIDQEFFLESVEVGIQEVNDVDGVEAKINVYSFDQEIYDINNPDDFVFENLDLIESQLHTFVNSDANTIKEIPVKATIPTGKIAVIELFVVDDFDRFFPGTNPVQTGESYYAGCGAGVLSNVKDLDVGVDLTDFQFVMRINGNIKTTNNTSLTVGSGSGESFPIGINTETWQASDAAGLSGECSFDVEVVSAVFDTPVAAAASGNNNTSFTANWNPVNGISFYQVFVFELPLNTPVSGFDGVVVNTTSLLVSGLDSSTPYGYNVRAVDGLDPTQYSTLSNIINTTTTIPAPSGLVADEITDKTFELSWNSISGISEYGVDISDDNFSTFIGQYDDRRVFDNEVTVSNMPPGTDLQVRIRAVNEGGSSVNSSPLNLKTEVETPFAFSATNISESTFTASWSEAEGAISYQIDVSSDGFNTFVLENQNVNGTLFEVTGLNPNTSYIYRIRSVDDIGIPGLNSNPIRTSTHAVPPVALEPVNSSSFGFTAAWMGSNDVFTFEFDLSSDDFATVDPSFDGIVVTGTSLLILGLDANTTYYYRLRAVSRLGVVSDNSNTISFTTPNNTGNVPPAPVAGEAADVGEEVFTANWSGTNTLFYTLDVSSDNFSTFLPGLEEKQLFASSLTIDGLNPDSDYQYRLRAFNNEGFSDYSNVISVRTVLGIEDLANLEGISAYPNPLRDRFNLVIDNAINGKYEISLFDHTGRLLNVREIQKDQLRSNSELDLRFYPSGVYYLTVQTDKAAEVIKLIKK